MPKSGHTLVSLQRGTTYHLIHTQQFTGFGAEDRSMHCVPGSRRSGVRALPYSSIAWRLNSRARLWPISPVVLQRLSTWVWIKLVPGADKASARQFHLCRILTRRIPTWLWLMPSCKWPVPMHTRSPCGTSSTVNAPSQHPGRFNPPYTCQHVLRCAYRRVVPASTLPSVAKK